MRMSEVVRGSVKKPMVHRVPLSPKHFLILSKWFSFAYKDKKVTSLADIPIGSELGPFTFNFQTITTPWNMECVAYEGMYFRSRHGVSELSIMVNRQHYPGMTWKWEYKALFRIVQRLICDVHNGQKKGTHKKVFPGLGAICSAMGIDCAEKGPCPHRCSTIN